MVLLVKQLEKIKKQEEQMDLSFCYHAVQIVLENAHSREKVNTQNHRYH